MAGNWCAQLGFDYVCSDTEDDTEWQPFDELNGLILADCSGCVFTQLKSIQIHFVTIVFF